MTTDELCQRLKTVHDRIHQATQATGRAESSVRLIAVSKKQPVSKIQGAIDCGQQDFGENYVQELLDKQDALPGRDICWHFIGPLQSNKTRPLAERVDWVHTIDRLKIAQRLNDQRPAQCPPLNVCIQVNVSDEASKSGIGLAELTDLAGLVWALPRLQLRGLMAIPAAAPDPQAQRAAFAALRQAYAALRAEGYALDTLSMGMSADLDAAIAEGATMVRIGTAIFGDRPT